MANKFLAGLMALAFCLIIARPAYAQDQLTPEKKALVKELMGPALTRLVGELITEEKNRLKTR
jgi:hypothetical protein